MTQSMSLEMQRGLQALTMCKKTCTTTLSYYLHNNTQDRDLSLMCLLRDCAEMCLMSTNLMIDGSEFMGRTFLICAEMCDRCAAACEIYSDDPQMMACAEACHACSQYCSSMGRLSSAYFRRPNFDTFEALVAS